AIHLPGISKAGFSNNGALRSFTFQGTKYVSVIDTYNRLYGYVDERTFHDRAMGGSPLSIELIVYIQSVRYKLEELQTNGWIYTRARELIDMGRYAQCVCSYKWQYVPEGHSMYGEIIFGTIPTHAQASRFNCSGKECNGIDG